MKFKELDDAQRSQYETNEFDACPNSLEAAKKRNLKIIEVSLLMQRVINLNKHNHIALF